MANNCGAGGGRAASDMPNKKFFKRNGGIYNDRQKTEND